MHDSGTMNTTSAANAMSAMDAIAGRRSIRKFEARALPKGDMESILRAGALAPSAKNRQPWRFTVAQGESKSALLRAMSAELDAFASKPAPAEFAGTEAKTIAGWARHTIAAMEQAPVTVLVTDPEEAAMSMPPGWFARMTEVANVQSVGACLQNMALAAHALGIGSLWICDIFLAYEAVLAWLGTDRLVVAAMSFGYAAESPPARPRAPLDALVDWR